MTLVLLFFWIVSAVLILAERKAVRLVIYLCVFSLTSTGCFVLLAAPDVAMAEVVVSLFSTIIFIVAFEKYYSLVDAPEEPEKKPSAFWKLFLPIGFTVALAALFIAFLPQSGLNLDLKNQYLAGFQGDVGGENAVTSIYLGYRMYDTLFEALMLLVSITALAHLSWHEDTFVSQGHKSDFYGSSIATATIRLVCPLLLVFCIYLVANGHISPGGGFQGGVVAAAFFICRYMIHDIYDIQIDRVITMEKLVFASILLLTILFIVLGVGAILPLPKAAYMVMMNLLIGIKVACGFLIVFYRFIALERR